MCKPVVFQVKLNNFYNIFLHFVKQCGMFKKFQHLKFLFLAPLLFFFEELIWLVFVAGIN